MTAVEWLLNEFQEAHKDFGGLDLEWLKRFEQAKEMEKKQIIEFTNDFIDEEAYGDYDGNVGRNKKVQQYYEETYENK
jgi:hypothetical protein